MGVTTKLDRELEFLRNLIEARIHNAAWRAFRPQPWQTPIGSGSYSDPTFNAVAYLEDDEGYQQLRKWYKEALQAALNDAQDLTGMI